MKFWQIVLGFDPKRKRQFPGEQVGEIVYLMTVFHWMKLVPFFFQVTVAVFTLIAFNLYSDLFAKLSPLSLFILNTIAITLIIHIICFRLYNYFLKVMMITNFRLIDIRHSVFLKREREVVPLTNIQDIRYQQNGILARLFKYGDLIVLGSSSDVKYQFHYVYKVNKVHHILVELCQNIMSQNQARGLKKHSSLTAPQSTVPKPI